MRNDVKQKNNGPGEYSSEFLVEACLRVLQMLSLKKSKKD